MAAWCAAVWTLRRLLSLVHGGDLLLEVALELPEKLGVDLHPALHVGLKMLKDHLRAGGIFCWFPNLRLTHEILHRDLRVDLIVVVIVDRHREPIIHNREFSHLALGLDLLLLVGVLIETRDQSRLIEFKDRFIQLALVDEWGLPQESFALDGALTTKVEVPAIARAVGSYRDDLVADVLGKFLVS